MHILTFGLKVKTNGRPVSRRAVRVIAGSLFIIIALFFAACTDPNDAETTPKSSPTAGSSPATAVATPSEPSKGLIKADPNPVPAGPEALSKTSISWNTQTDTFPVVITVSENGKPESDFAGGKKVGAAQAPWIQPNATYDFRLYVGTGANKKLIDHVLVTRNK
jgi:hypothetical protein